MSVHFPSLFQSSRTDILDLLLNAEEVDPGSGGLADSVTQLLSINMESDTQELQDKSGKAEENGVKKKKKKKGLTTEVSSSNNFCLDVNLAFLTNLTNLKELKCQAGMAQMVRANTVPRIRPGFESHQCLYIHVQVCGSKRLSCSAGHQEANRCLTRGEFEKSVRVLNLILSDLPTLC